MARSRPRERAAIAAVAALAFAAIALVGWTSPVGSAASPVPSGSEPAPGTLQRLVDAAQPGAVVVVPAGVYREEVTLNKQLILRGDGAEIRGSDVWSDWRADSSRWRSESAVPSFSGGGICREPRCAWPEQVFIDGRPLLQVATQPIAGQFSIDANRRVLIADDPAGRRIEVTVRERWLTVDATDVRVEGFAMRHAASPPQQGALQALPGADRLIVSHVQLSDAHGALISFQGVTGARLESSELSRGGQLGVQAGGDGTANLTIENNRITANNTEGFEPGWEAGGLKAGRAINLRVVDNEVADNGGPGIWCDIDCRNFTAAGNRIHGNTGPGIMFEISDGSSIQDNVVWENGWDYPTWGWGAGILIASSSGATVRDNLLAWNADGISVISQLRNKPGGDDVRDTSVIDNTVISEAAGGYLLAWLQDWPGSMYAADSRNIGSGNRFWDESAEPTSCRFEWSGCIDRLAAFVETPGGSGSAYISNEDAQVALAGARVPAHSIPHSADEPPRLRTVLLVAGAAGLVTLMLSGTTFVVLRRRRRHATDPTG